MLIEFSPALIRFFKVVILNRELASGSLFNVDGEERLNNYIKSLSASYKFEN
jgi:hypothetical protein